MERLCPPNRPAAGRTAAFTLLAFVWLLGGCALQPNRGVTFTPPNESGLKSYAKNDERERLVAASDFSMELIRFTDNRRPRSLEQNPPELAIDSYDPDRLLHGVSTRLPALFEKYLAYKPRMPKHYKVEIELRNLRTEVVNNGWYIGAFGRYEVDFEMEATARRPDSRVVLRETYKFSETLRRESPHGRSPSQALDESKLTALVDAAVRTTAMNFAWELRQRDARRWNLQDEPAPVPASSMRLVPQPVINRATGSQTGYGSELVIPATPRPMEEIVPALPYQPLEEQPSHGFDLLQPRG